MADLKQLQAAKEQTEATAWLTVKWWTGPNEGQPIIGENGETWRILIQNAQAPAYQRAISEFHLVRRLKLLVEQRAETADAPPIDPVQAALDVKREYDLYEMEKVRDLLVKDWDGLTDDGRIVSCSVANLKEYISEKWLPVYHQVKEFAETGANFGTEDAAVNEPIADIEKKVSDGSNGDAASSSAVEIETEAHAMTLAT